MKVMEGSKVLIVEESELLEMAHGKHYSHLHWTDFKVLPSHVEACDVMIFKDSLGRMVVLKCRF